MTAPEGPRPLPSRPASYSASFSDTGGLVLERRWSRRRRLPLLLIVGSLPILAALRILTSWHGPVDAVIWLVLGLVFVACGYPVLAILRNSTRVEVSQGGVFVRHGPLPLRRSRSFLASEVLRFEPASLPVGRRGRVWGVEVRLAGRKRRLRILEDLDHLSEAVELAAHMNAVLGVDEPAGHLPTASEAEPVPTSTQGPGAPIAAGDRSRS